MYFVIPVGFCFHQIKHAKLQRVFFFVQNDFIKNEIQQPRTEHYLVAEHGDHIYFFCRQLSIRIEFFLNILQHRFLC